METFSLKISEAENAALDILAMRGKCNRAEACRRAILSSAEAAPNDPNLSQKLDLLIAAISDLMAAHAEHTRASHTTSVKILRMSGQSAISSLAVARKDGLSGEVKAAYDTWLSNALKEVGNGQKSD